MTDAKRDLLVGAALDWGAADALLLQRAHPTRMRAREKEAARLLDLLRAEVRSIGRPVQWSG